MSRQEQIPNEHFLGILATAIRLEDHPFETIYVYLKKGLMPTPDNQVALDEAVQWVDKRSPEVDDKFSDGVIVTDEDYPLRCVTKRRTFDSEPQNLVIEYNRLTRPTFHVLIEHEIPKRIEEGYCFDTGHVMRFFQPTNPQRRNTDTWVTMNQHRSYGVDVLVRNKEQLIYNADGIRDYCSEHGLSFKLEE